MGPWNVVWDPDGHPVGIIDWDYAEPADPLRDIAFALEWSVPFCSDEECLRWRRFDSPPDRAARIEAFAAAYGLTSADGLVDAVLAGQQAFYDREVALASRGIQPAADDVASGYLETVRDRMQWTIDHRELLE
jgi:aminoglycoside phosphotransferase (APT) family kinase protein